MHCNLIIENIEKMNEVREKLNSIFKEKKIIKIEVFGNYCILKLNNKEEWNILIDEISKLNVKFILTPILEEGYYNGSLEEEMWPKLNEITYPNVGDNLDTF
ncbi:hypothetical protein [Cetobacterium sp.]|uniref:hypothetical protein n=1 Tax=Cetobacterium sp. TaxID=2071632 RepID=UPI0025BD1CE0|nr:hypothetical protein [Cetobacterium sp.]